MVLEWSLTANPKFLDERLSLKIALGHGSRIGQASYDDIY